jgi:hypothetical protein
MGKGEHPRKNHHKILKSQEANHKNSIGTCFLLFVIFNKVTYWKLLEKYLILSKHPFKGMKTKKN